MAELHWLDDEPESVLCDELVDDALGPEELLAAKQERALVKALLAGMSVKWQSIAWARWVDEQPQGRLAKQWNVTPSRIHQLEKKIRARFCKAFARG